MKKRAFSLALTLLLCLGLTIPAMAATDAAEGLTQIKVTGTNGQTLYGYADQNGNIVIPAEFEQLGKFVDGLATACKNGRWGFINAVGQVVVPMEYDHISSFNEDGIAEVVKDSLHGVIGDDGKICLSIAYDALILSDNTLDWQIHDDLIAVAKYNDAGELKWGTPTYLPIMYDEVRVVNRGVWPWG